MHPSDRPLQAMEWEGAIYVDPMLPFGLRSAPKIFNVIGLPRSSECTDALASLDDVCSQPGIPLAQHKRDSPTTCLTFLGIEVDTEAAEFRLPQDKLERLRSLLEDWGDRKACGRREHESLVGVLNHACKVVRSGRTFLRRMLDLLKGNHHPLRPHPIRLNRSFRSDLTWWRLFAARWNGVSYLPPSSNLLRLQMASDASGSWGCGAWYGTHWFQLQWNTQLAALTIMAKELLPVVLACAVWGRLGPVVTVLCDNQAVVYSVPAVTYLPRSPHNACCTPWL